MWLLTWNDFVGNVQDTSGSVFFDLQLFIGQVSHQITFMMPKKVQPGMLDIQHMCMLRMQDARMDHNEFFTSVRIEAMVFHGSNRIGHSTIGLNGQIGWSLGGAILAFPGAGV